VAEQEDPLAQALLQEAQEVGQRSVDVVPALVHQLTEKVQLLAAGLQLDQLQQPEHRGHKRAVNTRGGPEKCVWVCAH